MSYQGVNIRNAIVARPGYFLMDRDYKQIEFLLSALLAGETAIVKGFYDGKDYYKLVMVQMLRRDYDAIGKADRQLGKVIALGQAYGQEKHGLARKLKVNPDTAGEYMDAYWAGLARTKAARDEALAKAMQTGGIHTHFGRWRPLPDLYHTDKKIRAKAIRSVWNSIIQGTSADIIKIAMVRCHKALLGRDVHIILTVHDELVFEVSEKENFHEVDALIREAMEFPIKGIHQADKERAYHCPTDGEYGYKWGELYPLNDFKKKIKDETGQEIETVSPGFLTKFKDLINVSVSTKPTAPDVQVQVLAEVNPEPRPTIFVREVKGKQPMEDALPAGAYQPNEDPISQLLALARGEVAPIPVVPPPVVVVATKAPEPPPAQPIEPRTEPGPIPLRVESIGSPAQGATEVASASNGNDIRSVLPISAPSNGKDFQYPAMIVRVKQDLTEKHMTFLQALFKKFVGTHKVYLDYQGQMIETADAVLPSEQCLTYLKKALGDATEVETYDQLGKPSRKAIGF